MTDVSVLDVSVCIFVCMPTCVFMHTWVYMCVCAWQQGWCHSGRFSWLSDLNVCCGMNWISEVLEGDGGETKCVNPHRIFGLFIMISLCAHTSSTHTYTSTTHVHTCKGRMEEGTDEDVGIGNMIGKEKRKRMKDALRHVIHICKVIGW